MENLNNLKGKLSELNNYVSKVVKDPIIYSILRTGFKDCVYMVDVEIDSRKTKFALCNAMPDPDDCKEFEVQKDAGPLEFTIDLMRSGYYKERFKAEYHQTKIRYDKLHKMLIKAEAIARLHSGVTIVNSDANEDGATNRSDVTNANQLLVMEGFDLVNALFKRSNPTLKNPDEDATAENASDRLSLAYPLGKSGSALLTLVYNERQREFVGEGKRWYDLVRQAEYENSTTNVLTSHMAATNIVKNRLRQLYSMYNPVYSEEIKIAGVENGGALVQNPVWERYSK